ncbi:MAG: FAD-binding oxidoreductase [Actinobacteria bacterium]|nr:FAD-binding oxidoreductase [Actinomycetota bacterium]
MRRPDLGGGAAGGPLEPRSRILCGWGRTSPSRASVVRPRDAADVATALGAMGARGAIARGLGRSYGDVAQNGGGLVLDMTAQRGIERFDEDEGILAALAGTSIDDILRAIVPRGWFLPVTPGTRFVTLGGAIANDVHGKNHHGDGSLGDHLVGFELLLPDGQVRQVALASDPETYEATLGGLGLTGIIVRATVRLLPIGTSWTRVDTERAVDLEDLMGRMASDDHRYRYSVAWVDCLARGRSLGRGVLTRGDHATREELPSALARDPLVYSPRMLASVPPGVPNVVTRAAARSFNEVWFRKAPREERGRITSLTSFFYPLDAIADWNRLYGRRGFVQHQFVVPFGQERVVETAVELLSSGGSASFLAVLKRFGPGRGMLSFPAPGWTLALDLPAGQPGLAQLLDRIDRLVAEAGGRVYLAKDARLNPALLPDMYPDLDRWMDARERLDPGHAWRSDLERRLGLGARQRKDALT